MQRQAESRGSQGGTRLSRHHLLPALPRASPAVLGGKRVAVHRYNSPGQHAERLHVGFYMHGHEEVQHLHASERATDRHSLPKARSCFMRNNHLRNGTVS